MRSVCGRSTRSLGVTLSEQRGISIGIAPRASDNLDAALLYAPGRSELHLTINAKRRLRVTELHGDRHLFNALGATRPIGFSVRWFADDVEVPKEMIDDIAFTNRTEFRWACDIQIDRGKSSVVTIPVRQVFEPETKRGKLNIVYEYRWLFGLLRQQLSFDLFVYPNQVREAMLSGSDA